MSKENSCGDCGRYPHVKASGIMSGSCDRCSHFPPDGFRVCTSRSCYELNIHTMSGCPECGRKGIVPEDT